MPAAISAERWAAARALMRLETPTQARIAAAMGIHLTTLASRASRENWPVLDFRRKDIQDAHEKLRDRLIKRFVLGMEDVEQPDAEAEAALLSVRALPSGEDGATADVAGASEDLQPGELRERLIDLLSKQLGKVIALAERGFVDKARLDALLAMVRVVERSEALADQQATESQKRSDDELATLLGRIDERIVELARAYAERLGSGEHTAELG
jgi:hypothetical protein